MSNKQKLRAAARRSKARQECRVEVNHALTVEGRLPDAPTKEDLFRLLTRPKWRPGRRP